MHSKGLWEKKFLKTRQERVTIGKVYQCHGLALQKRVLEGLPPMLPCTGTLYMIYLASAEPQAASVLQNYPRPHHTYFLLWQSRKREKALAAQDSLGRNPRSTVYFQTDKGSLQLLPSSVLPSFLDYSLGTHKKLFFIKN